MVISSFKILAGDQETIAELWCTLNSSVSHGQFIESSQCECGLPVDNQSTAAADVVDGILQDLDRARGLNDCTEVRISQGLLVQMNY